MLPIRQTINALPCLNRTDKAVLIEVCQLAERGEQGWCTAKNDYLIEALASSLRTITRRLAVLEERGLLVSQGEGKARKLAPSAGLRACYAEASEVARQSAISNLANVASEPSQPSHSEPANLAKTAPEPSQSGQVGEVEPSHNASPNLATLGAQPSHFGSRVYRDQVNQDITSTPPTPEEWEAAQKKIADLQAENRQLKAKIQELVPPVAEPPREIAAETQGPQHSPASKALAAEMAKLWHITQQGNARKWMQLARFTHLMEQAGELAEVSRQFAGYALYREKRGIEPYNLDKYLGSEGNGYSGEWCAFDWPTKAKQARADRDAPPAAPPARAAASPTKARAQNWS